MVELIALSTVLDLFPLEYYHIFLIMQGIITAPILFAMEEFPQLREVINQGFHNPANIEVVSTIIKIAHVMEV